MAISDGQGSELEQLLDLATEHHRAGRLEAARALYRRLLLRLDATDVAAYFHLGHGLRSLGDLAAAAEAFRRAAPAGGPSVHRELGLTLLMQERPAEALETLLQAEELDCGDPETHFHIGHALQKLGRIDEALEQYDAALEIDPGISAAHINAANALHGSGKTPEAIRRLELAIAVAPEDANAHANLATVLLHSGRLEAAVWHCERAIELNPRLTVAHHFYSQAKKFTPGDPEIAQIEGLLGDASLSAPERTKLHFALGKMYDDCEQFDAAFEQFRLGNETAGHRADLSSDLRFIDRLVSTFTRGFFAQRDRFGSESELPIFVVGLPRSGTSLVEQILSSHPQVVGIGESSAIEDLVDRVADVTAPRRPYPEGAEHLDGSMLASFADRYLSTLSVADDSIVRVVDKMPFNFFHLGWIAILFPRARVIHCRRHPLDLCLSCYAQHFENPIPFTNDLMSLGSYHRQYDDLMAFWQRVLPLPILDLPYEELVADPDRWIRRLIEFADLEWDARCLDFERNDRVVRTASAWQVRQPIFSGSVGRWRHYEAHLGPLRSALGWEDSG